ncbi:hypothetical protein ACLK17_14440 [Escherichia coli]
MLRIALSTCRTSCLPMFNGLLLPCQHKGNVAPVVPDDIKPVIQEQTQQVTPTNPPVFCFS